MTFGRMLCAAQETNFSQQVGPANVSHVTVFFVVFFFGRRRRRPTEVHQVITLSSSSSSSQRCPSLSSSHPSMWNSRVAMYVCTGMCAVAQHFVVHSNFQFWRGVSVHNSTTLFWLNMNCTITLLMLFVTLSRGRPELYIVLPFGWLFSATQPTLTPSSTKTTTKTRQTSNHHPCHPRMCACIHHRIQHRPSIHPYTITYNTPQHTTRHNTTRLSPKFNNNQHPSVQHHADVACPSYRAEACRCPWLPRCCGWSVVQQVLLLLLPIVTLGFFICIWCIVHDDAVQRRQRREVSCGVTWRGVAWRCPRSTPLDLSPASRTVPVACRGIGPKPTLQPTIKRRRVVVHPEVWR